MNEEPGTYDTDTADALEMMGKGYERSQPSVIIQPPEVRIERHNGKNIEVERPAFVQVFTDFKGELQNVDPIALKVWLYIALSINRFEKISRPAIRTIALGTDLAINTVQDAIKRLEKTGLLVVHRGERRYNFYDVKYASTERRVNVSPADTNAANVSVRGGNVSEKPSNVSPIADTSLEGLDGLDNTSVSDEIFKRAKKTVDHILESERQAGSRYVNRGKIPETLLVYADVYNELTGQEPTKRVLYTWIKELTVWQEEGISVDNLRKAYQQADGKFPILRPGSLTNTAVALAAKGRITHSQQSFDPFASLKAYVERTATNAPATD